MKTAFVCKACGLATTGRLPRKGDGTEMYPRRHRGDAKIRRGKLSPVCSGVIEWALWVDVPDETRLFGERSHNKAP